MRRDFDIAMRRCLKRVDEQLPRAFALEPQELFCIDDHNGVPAMQGDMLRPFTVCQAHQFTQARFRVLKAPTPTGSLR